jgi:hypothetical protein
MTTAINSALANLDFGLTNTKDAKTSMNASKTLVEERNSALT